MNLKKLKADEAARKSLEESAFKTFEVLLETLSQAEKHN